jgi:hypothetical protein
MSAVFLFFVSITSKLSFVAANILEIVKISELNFFAHFDR